MALYSYTLLIIGSSIVFLSIRSYILRRKNIPVTLYVKALQDENSGQFDEAVIAYESALHEVDKIRFHTNLKNKIIEKIKMLHTVIDYKNNLRYIR